MQLEGEASPSPRHDSEELERTASTPAIREARSALVGQPISEWSEEQVQEWIGLIGLPPENVETVQKALAADHTEGEDLEELTKRQWTKLLTRSGVENAAELAERIANAERGVFEEEEQIVE